MFVSKLYFYKSIRQFFNLLVITSLFFFTLILLFDFLEIGRVAGKNNLPSYSILKFAILKNYISFNKVMPFIVLFSSLIFFRNKDVRNEIIAAKSLGINTLNILTPVLFGALFYGIINLVVLNPVGSAMVKKYHQHKNHRFSNIVPKNYVSINKSGMWLKQNIGDNKVIINALRMSYRDDKLHDVNIFIIDGEGAFIEQMSSKEMLLKKEGALLINAVKLDHNFNVYRNKYLSLPLKISLVDLSDDSLSLESVSIFKFWGYIEAAERFGFKTSKYVLSFFKDICAPLIFCAMTLIGYAYGFSKYSRQKSDYNVLFGIIIGFLIFFMNHFTFALGISGGISSTLAIISPVLLSNFLGVYLLLRKNL